jgi:excisionase family DNA binding protein
MRRSSKFMNVGQAATYLGVSAASLRNWSNRGLVPVYRTPGGQRRYDASDLDDFMHSMREPVEGENGSHGNANGRPAEREPVGQRG